jgi:hypothetical protein
MGFDLIHFGMLLKDIFGVSFKKLRWAHMIFANHVDIEVFEFVDPKEEQRENNFEYWKTRFFHIGITDPNQKNSREGWKATE